MRTDKCRSLLIRGLRFWGKPILHGSGRPMARIARHLPTKDCISGRHTECACYFATSGGLHQRTAHGVCLLLCEA